MFLNPPSIILLAVVVFISTTISVATDNLLNKVRYLAKGCGVGFVILDHLSIVVSGVDDGDERKAIDVIMTKLRSLCEETGIGFYSFP